MRTWQMLLTRLADWPERRESSKLNLPGRRPDWLTAHIAPASP